MLRPAVWVEASRPAVWVEASRVATKRRFASDLGRRILAVQPAQRDMFTIVPCGPKRGCSGKKELLYAINAGRDRYRFQSPRRFFARDSRSPDSVPLRPGPVAAQLAVLEFELSDRRWRSR